jgi:high affinity Mn2+ porin
MSMKRSSWVALAALLALAVRPCAAQGGPVGPAAVAEPFPVADPSPVAGSAAMPEPAAAPEPAARPVAAEPPPSPLPEWVPRLLGAQFTYIGQRLIGFHAAYSGAQSLKSTGDQQATDTYGLYFGARLARRLQAYLDLEMARGHGISQVFGLGGPTNGDVLRQGTVDLGMGPYVARAYLRYLLPLGSETEPAERGMDRFPGREPANRLEIKAGKLALTDDFDQNRYANTARGQFMNWSLFNNTAWDYAADTRGYTFGVMAAWVNPTWTLRAATVQMPTSANGNVFDKHFDRARGDNLELQLGPDRRGTIVRLLAYQNHGRMGIYRQAIDRGLSAGARPDVAADDREGRRKVGCGLNVEQPLADDGETGLFLRLGWNDGRTEDFAFTEVDRVVSGGVQVAGASWHRPEDRVGLGATAHGLSRDHRDYLAAGGLGFLLGDGALRYGWEEILELYYRFQLGKHWQLSPDVQAIRNPGYNRDRGPAPVLSLRANWHW